jgi:predicted O-methyltransferase YrrM
VAATIVEQDVDATGSITSQVEGGFFDSYVAAIDDEPDESLDVVIVDGRARVECVRRAMPKVRSGGLLILDDTQRARYRPAIELLAGWERQVFTGLKPGDQHPAQTSAWRKPMLLS